MMFALCAISEACRSACDDAGEATRGNIRAVSVGTYVSYTYTESSCASVQGEGPPGHFKECFRPSQVKLIE